MPTDLWTPSQTEKARELFAVYATPLEFMSIIGRSKSAAYSHLYHLENKAAVMERRQACRIRRGRPVTLANPIFHAPSIEMMEEAKFRNEASRSTTSWLMGDPAPGDSALDKMRQ